MEPEILQNMQNFPGVGFKEYDTCNTRNFGQCFLLSTKLSFKPKEDFFKKSEVYGGDYVSED